MLGTITIKVFVHKMGIRKVLEIKKKMIQYCWNVTIFINFNSAKMSLTNMKEIKRKCQLLSNMKMYYICGKH